MSITLVNKETTTVMELLIKSTEKFVSCTQTLFSSLPIIGKSLTQGRAMNVLTICGSRLMKSCPIGTTVAEIKTKTTTISSTKQPRTLRAANALGIRPADMESTVSTSSE